MWVIGVGQVHFLLRQMPNCQCLNLQMIYLPSTHTQAKLNYRYVLQIRVEVELIDCSDNTHACDPQCHSRAACHSSPGWGNKRRGTKWIAGAWSKWQMGP